MIYQCPNCEEEWDDTKVKVLEFKFWPCCEKKVIGKLKQKKEPSWEKKK